MHARILCLGIAALTGLTRLSAQELPPPSVGGGVDIEATDGAEVKEQSHDYLPAKPYVILTERIERSVWPQVVQSLEPAAPGSRNSTFILDVSYAANHPEVIGPIRGVGIPYLGAESRYREITLQTVWNNAGHANFELTAVSEDGMENYRIAGTGEGRIFGPGSDGPGNLPFPRFHVGDVSATEGPVGWFTWTWGAEYRHLSGIQYYWTQVQPDGSVAVFHTHAYDLVAPGLGQFKPLGVLTTTGTVGHGPKAVLTTQPLTATDAYGKLQAAMWNFTDTYQPVTDAEAHYAFSPDKASVSKLRYKLQLQPGLARTITWMETFTPEGAGEPTDIQFRSENVAANATATQAYTIDPFARVGNQPGRYRVVAFESDNFDATLTADTNGDGALLPASGPMTDHVIANADAISASQPYQLLANLDDDDSDGAPDAFDDHVNGPDDLADFFPVFLNIKSLLAALPSGVVCKLSHADGALNFVYTDLKQYNAFSFRDDPWGYAYGPDFEQTAAEATVRPITEDGVPLSADFLDRIRNDSQGIILIEARFSSPAPLVLTLETGTGVAFVALPLQVTSYGLYVDVNRDDEIKIEGSDAVTMEKPYHFWINDDDDQGPAEGNDIPDRPVESADYNNAVVDSVRDLVDFFPVYLDIKQLLTVLPHTTAGITYKVRQAEGALNFVYTNRTREQAFDFQKQILATGFGPAFTQAAGAATTEQITATGVTLSTAFLDGVKNNDWGVILVEGRVATTAPLHLVVEKDGAEVAQLALKIKISPVDEMFRQVNLTQRVQEYDAYGSETFIAPPKPALPTRTAEPSDYPDSHTNGKYFIFIHGFNVDADSARGWNAEVFKRLHAMGSKARFVGVQWNGTPPSIIPGKYLDYHKAVFQAFQTGDLLAELLSFANGADVTVAAHSLGNIVTSHAIQDGGFTPTRYFMINAASAIEAYSLSDASGQFAKMVEDDWQSYDANHNATRLYASRWHELFPPSDNRSALTWKERFSNILPRAYNFYSGQEDVVANGDQIIDASLLQLALEGSIGDLLTGAYSWKLQELVKGARLTDSLAAAVLERRQGGWGFNLNDWHTVTTPPGPPGKGGAAVWHLLEPDETMSLVSDDALKTKPFFRRFLEPQLMDPDLIVASAKAGETKVKYDVLARGIPAMSNAVAANPLPSLGNERNFDMPGDGIAKDAAGNKLTLPTPNNQWRHSDFKVIALPYVYPMYEAMISRGGLK